MDAKFLTLTGLLSAAAFAGVWFITAPTASGVAPPAAEAPSVKPRQQHYVVEAPPQDMEPEPLYAGDEPRRAYTAPSRSSVYYSGCNAVRAAGAAPLHAGEPGYRPEMDGDGDGIACEPHRTRY